MHSKVISIQILRAIACLLVLQVHFLPIIPLVHADIYGAIGVDLFFIISGYIIASSIKKLPENKPASIFFINRFSRVVPYYFFLNLLTLIFLIFTFHRFPLFQIIDSFLFIPEPNDPIIFLGWSLNHEILFYSVITISLLVIPTSKKLFSGAVFFLIIAISHLIPRTNNLHINYCLDFLSASINYEFLLGFMIFKFKDAILPFFKSNIVCFFCACLFLLLLLTIKEEHIFSHYKGNYFRDYIIITKTGFVIHRFWICGIACMLIFLCFLAREDKLKRFHNSLLVKIGNASFSVYLLHGVLLTILPTFFLGSLWLRIALCIISLIIAVKAVRLESFVGNHTKQYLDNLLQKNGKSVIISRNVRKEDSRVLNTANSKKTAI